MDRKTSRTTRLGLVSLSDEKRGCVCINGLFFDPDEAKVSATDAGFLLGDGVFESLRACDGVPYLLDRHLERLYGGAAELEFERMPLAETIIELVYRSLQRSELGDTYVRITVTRGSGCVGLAPPPEPPTIAISVLPAPPAVEGSGLHATLLHGCPAPHRTVKSTSWQHAVMARRRVQRSGADEGIYVSTDGRVLEGVTSNVFVVRDQVMVTPRTAECLPGITRSRLLELSREAGIEVHEQAVSLEELDQADEVFLTNAVQGLREVSSIEGGAVACGLGESLFARMCELYREDRGVMAGAVR
jgi:branched-subunit amino acid aminotransferase/4-amino-4-deoxychorismate lyase